MGCDIHVYAERKNAAGKWEQIELVQPILDDRSYSRFGFLANVRNYSGIPPIAEPRGLPSDMSAAVTQECEDWKFDAHSSSYLLVSELLEFDYDKPCEDRRVTKQIGPNSYDGGCTCPIGQGKKTTFREFLRESFFVELEKLKDVKAERIIFWFDN